MASLVERLVLYVLQDQYLKALHDGRGECDGAVVIEAGLFGHRDNGGGFKT